MCLKWVPGRADFSNLLLKRDKGKLREWRRVSCGFRPIFRDSLAGVKIVEESSCSGFVAKKN